MNKLVIPAIIACSLAPSLYGLINLGEGQIDLNLQVSSYYDTEIRARASGEEDFVFSLRPSLQYVRKSRNLDFSAAVGIDSKFYMDHGKYDDTDVFFDLDISPSARMQTSRFVFTGDLLFNNETKSEDSIGEIVTIRNYGASAQLVYDPNRHYTLTGALSYRNRDPDLDTYYDTETLDASVNVEIPVKESFNMTAGLGYRDTASDGPTTDSQTMTYSAGISGNLLPKLRGRISAGMQDRSFDSNLREDSTTPYLSTSLVWSVDETNSVTLTASQGFGTTIDDRSSENAAVRLTGRRQISRDLSGEVYVAYERDKYISSTLADRDDKETSLGATVTYQLVRWGSVSLDLRYSDQSSTVDLYDFDRLRAGVRFAGRW